MGHDEVLALVEIGAILLVLGLLGALSARLNLSPIPLYLLAGLAFGKGGIVPLATSEEFISTGASIGVILLLFTLGLEYTASELITTMRRSTVGGVVDVVFNAAPGVVAALLLGWGPIAAAVLGGITYISSSGIIAKVTSDLGWLGNREVPTVLSLVVFEDLVMVVYLPILAALLAGADVTEVGLSLTVAAVFVIVALTASLRFRRQIEWFLVPPHQEPSDEVLLLKLLGLTLLIAGLAESVHVSAAVGAFLVGIALSGPLAHTARNLVTPLRDLFGAVFFVFFGLSTDPRQLPQVAGLALALAAAGALTKFGTGWYAARRAGVGTAGRIRAGAALIARGEFNIVIAGLAVAAGGVEPQLGPLAAAYVLVLAVTGPLAARGAEPLARAVARRRHPTPAEG